MVRPQIKKFRSLTNMMLYCEDFQFNAYLKKKKKSLNVVGVVKFDTDTSYFEAARVVIYSVIWFMMQLFNQTTTCSYISYTCLILGTGQACAEVSQGYQQKFCSRCFELEGM